MLVVDDLGRILSTLGVLLFDPGFALAMTGGCISGVASGPRMRIRLVWHRCCIHLLDRVGDLLSF